MEKLTTLQQIKKAILRTLSDATKQVAEVAETSINAIDEVEKSKQDKSIHSAFTIPTSGWNSDSTADYPYYYDVAVSGVTASDRADVPLSPASVSAAAKCGICPFSETLTGKVRIRTAKIPTAAISAEYWIEKG